MTAARYGPFYERCRQLPVGHRHCTHGHLIDCPTPDECPSFVEPAERTGFVVRAGARCWVFGSEVAALAHVEKLPPNGRVRYRRALTPAEVDALVARLGPHVRVEDRR